MQKLTAILLLFSFHAIGQVSMVSGRYREMNIAYDKKANLFTGFYENSTGYDEQTKEPRFSCIFYLHGKLTADRIQVNTYFPLDVTNDLIKGEVRVISDTEIIIHLSEEHGGCWNVEQFAKDPVTFQLQKSENWVQIRYADIEKVYFHSDKSYEKRQKAYILKGDIVYIEKIDGDWAFCSYRGARITKGWIKLSDLNRTE